MTFNLDNYEPVAPRLARWLETVVKSSVTPRVITTLHAYAPGEWCIFKAELWEGDTLISTGYAEEHHTDRGVNSTSHMENCETSAIGRALANCGYAGSDPSKRPSREEMTKVQRMTPSDSPESTQRPQASPNKAASDAQLGLIRTLSKKLGFEAHFPPNFTSYDASQVIQELKGNVIPLAIRAESFEDPF
jgi:hypothetical protein